MELKNYQKRVIEDLKKYLELLAETQNMSKAYRRFWEDKGVTVGGLDGMPSYQYILRGAPNLCLKVPTGGGKTFLACNAIRPIFDALPTKIKVVVWLVPSEAILTQTLRALKDPGHPYRQKINADFGSRVEVYTKDELLNGQNFNITVVSEQLSIMVLSYDSFRGREDLRARRENGNLADMARALGAPEHPLEGTDETALLQIINQLSPLVVVDESHHARTELSREMLANFNPCFVLDLTATPRAESNIISYVDPLELKKEHMVKIPIIACNRSSQQEIVADAIDLRNRLEELAHNEEENTGLYVRPIVLFQAQPRNANDSTTFSGLREKLVRAGIPSEEIAIKTANVNELNDKDLLSPDCPIRYIITVNALKEGWDCPFAYILASIANRTSRIDVEQIVGRILRQPYTREHNQGSLNMSYVLTSSANFAETLGEIISGLKYAGFDERDCLEGAGSDRPVYAPDIPAGHDNSATGLEDIDSESLRRELEARQEQRAANPQGNTHPGSISEILTQAENEQGRMNEALNQVGEENFFIPREVRNRNRIRDFYMKEEFAEELNGIKIPQFVLKTAPSIFAEKGCNFTKLNKENLGKGFTLRDKEPPSFENVDMEIRRVDISDDNFPQVFSAEAADQQFMRDVFSTYNPKEKIRLCKDIIHNHLNRMDNVSANELREFINLTVGRFNSDTLSKLEERPHLFASHIKEYIGKLLEDHYKTCFNEWFKAGRITCAPLYELPRFISMSEAESTTNYSKSLYKAENGNINNYESEMILRLVNMDNIKWWHRNSQYGGFCLNGFINYYPDFIVMTNSGKIVLIETKGDHLDNPTTRKKLELGRNWQSAAGDNFRHYIVFQNTDSEQEGACNFDSFLAILRGL